MSPPNPRPRYLWICQRCAFAVEVGKWRDHRRACEGKQTCHECGSFFPCRERRCPFREVRPVEIAMGWPALAPQARKLRKVGLRARKTAGGWLVWFVGEASETIRPRRTWLRAFNAAEKRRPDVDLRPTEFYA